MTRTLDDVTPDEWDAVAQKFGGETSKTDGDQYREARKRKKIAGGTMYKPKIITNNTIMYIVPNTIIRDILSV